jgi:cation/acetate symporter
MSDFVTTIGQPNPTSIIFFFVFIAATLVITYFAAKKSLSPSQFYAAGRSVTGLQNGLALSGDYMSAASFWASPGWFRSEGTTV